MSETVLILGGTREAAELAAELARTHPGWRIVTSLAGRTREPRPVAGAVRIGGFGGADGLAGWMRAEGVTRLIDATHPFARNISKNAKAAAAATGIPLEIRSRAPWERQAGDNWIETGSAEEARDAIPPDARVLLALGSQHIDMFATRADVHFIVRMVDPPTTPLPFAHHELVVGRPGSDAANEATMLKQHRVTHIVCRNSGGAGAYAKIEAARALSVPVIMIDR
ncbi:cobalt-precorrin-6A reductase [Oricola sp.]|uniref:cobalt-precorrin-6A reductase n=1 Tax=Oricola sp. TaxID=1979950 RepID=UPI003BAB5CDA